MVFAYQRMWLATFALGTVVLSACANVVPTNALDEFNKHNADQAHVQKVRDERIVLTTSRGEVVIRVLPQVAPQTIEHVRNLVLQGTYDGTRFHRALKSPRPYLVQGGDPLTRGAPGTDFVYAPEDGPGKPVAGTGGGETLVAAEANDLPHVAGAVALARRSDGTGGSQFYVALDTLPHLDGTATIFGMVERGWSVVQKIERGDVIARASLVGTTKLDPTAKADPPPLPPSAYNDVTH